MRTSFFLFSILFFFAISINAQEATTTVSKQIGITGLPLLYLNGGTGNAPGLNGLALYGNAGWFIKKHNVIGLRPFFGIVDSGDEYNQRIHSAGSNVYYRRYLNQKRWSFFVDANAGFGYTWYSSRFPDYDDFLKGLNGIMFNCALGPGIDFEINDGLNIEFIIQYLYMRNISHPDNTTPGKTVIPSIGIQQFF